MQLGATGIVYGTHGRQYQVTDARTGTTTFTYCADDRVHTVTTPDPDGEGPQAAQVTTTVYDSMGRQATVTLPDSGEVHTTYWPTGEVKRRCHLAHLP